VVKAYAKATFSEQSVAELALLLAASSKELEKGDMSQVEAMLFGQATALQTVFMSLARRASVQESLLQYETLLRLALKAQSQSRATLETLAAIKNPPVIYARQANVTTGPQQVNNGLPSRAREIESERSKLSGGGSHELLPDTRASQVESRVNPPVGAVDKVHRA
jgi:hypothetical protein